MTTYETNKQKLCDAIIHGAMALAVTNDHDSRRKVLRSIIDSARVGLWLEDAQEAFENGDLEALRNAPVKNGF